MGVALVKVFEEPIKGLFTFVQLVFCRLSLPAPYLALGAGDDQDERDHGELGHNHALGERARNHDEQDKERGREGKGGKDTDGRGRHRAQMANQQHRRTF